MRVLSRHEIAEHLTWALEYFLIDDELDEWIIDQLLDRLGVRHGEGHDCCRVRSKISLIVTKLKAEERGVPVTW